MIMFCSSHLLGCYCHPYCYVTSVDWIQKAGELEFGAQNANKLQNVDACLHFLLPTNASWRAPIIQTGYSIRNRDHSSVLIRRIVASRFQRMAERRSLTCFEPTR